MIPKAIRVFPLSRMKEPNEFGTIQKTYDFFKRTLPSRTPSGRFNIRTARSIFEKNSLILFQYTERKDEEKIIGHAFLLSNNYVPDNKVFGYIGYYLLNPDSIIMYKHPISKAGIYRIWKKKLFQAKAKLDPAKYDEYMRLLKFKGNLPNNY